MYFSSRVYKSTVVKATEWHDQGCYSEQALEAPNEQIQEISFQNISSRERLKTKPRVSKKITTPDWLSRDQRWPIGREVFFSSQEPFKNAINNEEKLFHASADRIAHFDNMQVQRHQQISGDQVQTLEETS